MIGCTKFTHGVVWCHEKYVDNVRRRYYYPYKSYTMEHSLDFLDNIIVIIIPQMFKYLLGKLAFVQSLKVHNVFPKVTFPPWLHPVKIWLQSVSG